MKIYVNFKNLHNYFRIGNFIIELVRIHHRLWHIWFFIWINSHSQERPCSLRKAPPFRQFFLWDSNSLYNKHNISFVFPGETALSTKSASDPTVRVLPAHTATTMAIRTIVAIGQGQGRATNTEGAAIEGSAAVEDDMAMIQCMTCIGWEGGYI